MPSIAIPIAEQSTYFLSIIIPFRNEEKNLRTLIDTLRMLDYPIDRFEILLIDDHSEDNSVKVVSQFAVHFPNFKIISASSTGKKFAIAQGVQESVGEIIATSDADCELPVDWLKSINGQFQNPSVKMALGGVRIKPSNTFFSTLQAMEFSSLMGSAAGTLNLGIPTMCNGANLSYRKSAFVGVGGFDGNAHIASGDDEFLMRKIADRFGASSLRFIKNSNAVVTTNSQASFNDFLTQRIRWAGKWRHNSSWVTRTLAVFILVFQLSWLVAIGSLFFQPWSNTMLSLIIAKMALEGFFLLSVSRFMRQKFHWTAFLTLQIVYPMYVSAIGLLANFIPVSWKGRSILDDIYH